MLLTDISVLYRFKPEPPLDAQVAVGDFLIGRRRHFDNGVVLHMEGQRAAHAAVATYGIGFALFVFIPCPFLAHGVLRVEHQRASWTNRDTVATVHACRFC